ncbi:type II toxin-antitoxin system HipA family toxin [Bordetella genomosp. 11]|uniref:Toxin HipA n=1 Tax=Bordetella genomosp. 11 TaxID=1416808 RepID=A0A261UNU5_9BORD|nr:type II toxin-antitoxin system HipA family toxin [Bordetella genomosp. 11]OZI63042.1 toxin HipA [Bordetella genomosp. 11]
MARRMHQLDIWMNGSRVGRWANEAGESSLAYDPAWIEHPAGRPLSLSLPFRYDNAPYKGPVVHDFFDNLLPDSDAIRRRLAQHHRANSVAPFDLLAVLGRDCVGAIQLLRPDDVPTGLDHIEADPLSEADIAAILRSAVSGTPLGHDDHTADLRLSIAGAQEKTALLRHQGQWLRPRGSTPTTHILKLPMGLVGAMQADMHTSVENEWLCSKLAAAYGLAVAHCDIAHFQDQKALVVERFDRRFTDAGAIVRLPQEDMCQALGVSPLRKYQADGGPGITDIISKVLDNSQRERDVRDFYKAQIFFWMLAATDGHAKNFSIALLAGGRYHATPLYDILSAHPIIGGKRAQLAPQRAKMAMGVKGASGLHYRIADIRRRHWYSHATEIGLDRQTVDAIIRELIEATEPAIDAAAAMLPPRFPHHVAESIFAGLRAQRDKLARQENEAG